MNYDYFYDAQAESYSFIRVPRLLMTSEEFRGLSTDAKMLYALLLDRMGLSMRNGWLDEEGRVYIYYTLNEIQEDMSCGRDKATKLLKELDTQNGIGLIERIKQGQGKPARIYVRQFSRSDTEDSPNGNQTAPCTTKPGRPDSGKQDVIVSKNRKSWLLETGSIDCGKTEGNYTNNNYTENSYTDPSIYPSESEKNTDARKWNNYPLQTISCGNGEMVMLPLTRDHYYSARVRYDASQ